MLFETISLFILINLTVGLTITDYSTCNWFGNDTNVPIYPIDICTTYSDETELDGLSIYSTKLQCDSNGELLQFEWNNTDCDGQAYNTNNFNKEDGYYFNCEAATSCPYVKIIFGELSNISNPEGHDHICAYDKRKYRELAIVTNICIDVLKEFNVSYYVDCDAKSLTYSDYIDATCTQKYDTFVITEGCDDPFDINQYVQISECDDANYNPSNSPMPTVTRLTNMPSETPAVRTPSPTISTTKRLPTMIIPSTIQTTLKPTRSPIIDGGGKKSNSLSSKDSPYIIVVVLLCVIIVVLILVVFYIISRQKKLKAEVLLNESVNVTQ